MTTQQIKEIIKKELPDIFRKDVEMRRFILKISSEQFADKTKTEDRFDRLLAELQKDREKQDKKWEENQKIIREMLSRLDKFDERFAELQKDREEQSRKWEEQKSEDNKKREEQRSEDKKMREEQNKKWEKQKAEDNKKWEEQKAEDNKKREEQNKKWEEQKAEDNKKWEEQNKKWWEQSEKWWDENEKDKKNWEEQKKKWEKSDKRLDKLDSTLGAIGARWGIYTEESFRNALKEILEENFDIEVINVNEFDNDGEVFGQPDQIELDIIIKNGLLIICEIKSSMSKSDVIMFHKKVKFYEKRHNRKSSSIIIISPMVDAKAKTVANELGIKVYSHAQDVKKKIFSGKKH